ncbi:MAG: GNAT family N-acetyltransferase [Hyphomicrobiales bacterium]|nr:MAG: GNAT family N-acetyltransferase [Hyphomicrobiales bacterium]
MSGSSIRPAQEKDLPAIVEIYNQAVRETTAIWNDVEVDLDNRLVWFNARLAAGFPVFVGVDDDDTAIGYASYGPFRPFDGYAKTVENSVYVAPVAHGKGLGKALVQTLTEHASGAGLHIMVAAIEAENTVSIRLHEKLGFVETGRMPQVGRKFGRLLDLVLLQRSL